MHRFFSDQITGEAARITGDDVRHIVRVLRLRPDDAIRLCDGCGNEYDAVITRLADDAVDCRVGKPYPSKSEPQCRVTLFQCLPKTGKMETIVQKCTELGVAAVVPVVSSRCVALPGNSFEIKRVRYQRVAEEAAKQSRRGVIPQFGALTPIERIDPAAFDLFLTAYEEESTGKLKSVLKKNRTAKRVGVLIGPEGGFAAEEVNRLNACGAQSVSLGARILRTETAGMAMLAQILYEVEK